MRVVGKVQAVRGRESFSGAGLTVSIDSVDVVVSGAAGVDVTRRLHSPSQLSTCHSAIGHCRCSRLYLYRLAEHDRPIERCNPMTVTRAGIENIVSVNLYGQ